MLVLLLLLLVLLLLVLLLLLLLLPLLPLLMSLVLLPTVGRRMRLVAAEGHPPRTICKTDLHRPRCQQQVALLRSPVRGSDIGAATIPTAGQVAAVADATAHPKRKHPLGRHCRSDRHAGPLANHPGYGSGFDFDLTDAIANSGRPRCWCPLLSPATATETAKGQKALPPAKPTANPGCQRCSHRANHLADALRLDLGLKSWLANPAEGPARRH
mmetsp:Transcript_3591/g.8197  ORF Transcript_3591/g.8197 Transcript_3591/m.8197 type:complete len:214 (-) Transcript_3591:76-717(-)